MNIALLLTCVPNLTSCPHLLAAIIYNANDPLHLIQTPNPTSASFFSGFAIFFFDPRAICYFHFTLHGNVEAICKPQEA